MQQAGKPHQQVALGNDPAGLFLQGLVVEPVKMAGKGAWWLASHPRAMGCAGVTAGATLAVPPEASVLALSAVLSGFGGFALRNPSAIRDLALDQVRRISYAYQWDQRMRACKLDVLDEIPKVKQVQRVAWGERVRIVLPHGLAPEDVQKRNPQLAWTFGRKPRCHVRVIGDRVWLEFSDGKQLRKPLTAPPIPRTMNLESLRLGKREDGKPWNLQVLDPEQGYRHLFVAGATGAGKSGIFWQAIREMAPGIRDGLLELNVADPKFGVEFDKVQPLCKRYAEDEADIAAMLSEVRKLIAARAEEMKAQGIRQHVPRPGSPAIALFIDEFPSLLRDCQDQKLAKQMEQDARVLLRLGRVFGVFLWVATQDPRVESFPLRSFFVDEIGLRVRQANHVDMIYGKGARESGVTLDLIPKDMPGTGFEIREDGVMMVRGFHVTKNLIGDLVAEYGQRDADDRRALEEEFNVEEESDGAGSDAIGDRRPRSEP